VPNGSCFLRLTNRRWEQSRSRGPSALCGSDTSEARLWTSMSTGFQCATCGQWHDELPLDFGFAEPDYVVGLDENEPSAV
jgi:hypothetical protein